MKVVLLRVGVDSAKESGGIYGPLYQNGSFELMPIPDKYRIGKQTYGSIIGRHRLPLVHYFPKLRQQSMINCPCHVDPEFKTRTYGDPTRPKALLRELCKGDLLVFYAGLEGCDFKSARALYLVGYFDVRAAGLAQDFSSTELRNLFVENFHVRHPQVFEEQRRHLVLVKGSEKSRLLKKAIRISDIGRDRLGQPIYVLSSEMQKIFGKFTGLGSIQRSNPRWVDSAFVEQAAEYVKSLE